MQRLANQWLGCTAAGVIICRCGRLGRDCLSAAGLTSCLQRILTTVVDSLTVVAGNSVFH